MLGLVGRIVNERKDILKFQKFLEILAQNKKIMLPLYKNIFESQEVYAPVKIKSNNIVIKNGTKKSYLSINANGYSVSQSVSE